MNLLKVFKFLFFLTHDRTDKRNQHFSKHLEEELKLENAQWNRNWFSFFNAQVHVAHSLRRFWTGRDIYYKRFFHSHFRKKSSLVQVHDIHYYKSDHCWLVCWKLKLIFWKILPLGLAVSEVLKVPFIFVCEVLISHLCVIFLDFPFYWKKVM